MLKRLRRKFTCILMIFISVTLFAVFLLLFSSVQNDLEEQSLYNLHVLSRIPSHIESARDAEQVRVPYLILEEGPNGELLSSRDSFFMQMDEPLLRRLLDIGLNSEEDTGTLKEYNLRYLRSYSPHGSKVVFVDISGETDTLNNLIRTSIFIGLASLAAFYLISLLLARWAVKPVELAWQREQQFITDASHELKTPLSVIITNLELLREAGTPEQREQYTKNIQTMSLQMRELTQNLLELAKLDNGGSQASFTTLNLSQLFESAILPFEAVFFEQGLEFNSQIEQDIFGPGNEPQLRQVIEILLDNAQKYALPHSQVTLRFQKGPRGYCQLHVNSLGDTLSKEQLRHIFDRFYRCDTARTRDQSYGLGLSIAQSIVTEHRGKIWAQSKNGMNTFFVQLPTAAK